MITILIMMAGCAAKIATESGGTSGTAAGSAALPATHLVFAVQPSTPTGAAAAFTTPPTIAVKDAAEGIVVESGAAIGLKVYLDPGCTIEYLAGTLGVQSGTASAGTWIAAGISYSRVGTFYLGASSTGLTSACSNSFVIQPGSPSALAFAAQPSVPNTVSENFTEQPTVAVRDSSGNTVTSSAAAIQLSVYSDSGCTAPAAGTLSVTNGNAASGLWSLAALNFDQVGTFYLKAASAGLDDACSTAFNVGANGVASGWAWVAGPKRSAAAGTFLTQGVPYGPDSAYPPARRNPAFWQDTKGSFWLFAGETKGFNRLGDMWKFNPSQSTWTWVTGKRAKRYVGSVGTQGTAYDSDTHYPGSTEDVAYWADDNDDFWVFGGASVYSGNCVGQMWKYRSSADTWTLISDPAEYRATYGTKGTAYAPATHYPGHRCGAHSWKDSAGMFWLFGGVGQGPNGWGTFNDLWKYDPLTDRWTWVAGASDTDANGSVGVRGTAYSESLHFPGARYGSARWVDASGNFWIYGGFGRDSAGASGYLGDLWKYEPVTNQWTWVAGSSTRYTSAPTYGTKGTAYDANVQNPRGRYYPQSWTDPSGNFWLYGGIYGAPYSDIWKYNPALNQWTWVAGQSSGDTAASLGVKGVAYGADVHFPRSRHSAAAWADTSGNLWIYGGQVNSNGDIGRDFWKYSSSTNEWTWLAGVDEVAELGVYGTKGSVYPETTRYPSGRTDASGALDSAGNIFFFGGSGPATTEGTLTNNDVWKYFPATNEWAYLAGVAAYNPAVYGTKGVAYAADTKYPGGRNDAGVSWVDGADRLWIFGGFGRTDTSSGYLNEIWMFDPSTIKWTWVAGSGANPNGAYGSKGTSYPADTNFPGGREKMAQWVDAGKNLWIYGGTGYSAASNGTLADLWKFDVAAGEWTWIAGSNGVTQAASYGTKGVAYGADVHSPGSRASAATWMDSAGKFWLYGGFISSGGNNHYQSDLWKYDPASNEWTWVAGSNAFDVPADYGTLGTAYNADTKHPGSRYDAAGWTDAVGNLWLFGGGTRDATSTLGRMNDLWKYDISANQWTWVGGSREVEHTGGYGVKGTLYDQTVYAPESRAGSIAWRDGAGALWLLGGDGLRNIWKYVP